jgi:hypothetical protein
MVSIDGVSAKLSFADWDTRVGANFNTYYYIPENPDEDSKCIFYGQEIIEKTGLEKRKTEKEIDAFLLCSPFADWDGS